MIEDYCIEWEAHASSGLYIPSTRERALQVASEGSRVFPVCRPGGQHYHHDSPLPCTRQGKRPLIRKWQRCSTSRRTLIEEWYERWPDANYGIATGPSGLTVVDIDASHGGLDSMIKFQAEFGHLPITRTVLTGSGGGSKHLYYRGATSRSLTSLAGYPGIDIRSWGGMAVGPGSVHRSGGIYQWDDENVPIADTPPFLRELISVPVKMTAGLDPDDLPDTIPQGSRDATLFRLGCRLRDNGMPFATAMIAAEVYHRRCAQPGDDPFTIQDAQKALGRAYRYDTSASSFVENVLQTEGQAWPDEARWVARIIARWMRNDLVRLGRRRMSLEAGISLRRVARAIEFLADAANPLFFRAPGRPGVASLRNTDAFLLNRGFVDALYVERGPR